MLGEKAREGADKASEAARQAREFAERQRGTMTTAIERGREAYQQARARRHHAGRHGRRAAVNEWSGVFLAVIAVATLVMALIQVGAIVVALKAGEAGAGRWWRRSSATCSRCSRR